MNAHVKRWSMTLFLLAATLQVAAVSFAGPSARSRGATNWYGGPAYLGKPTLAVTSALVYAGGGPGDFSIQRALVSMLGTKAVDAEVAKLTKQYGKVRVREYLDGMNLAVSDGLKRAGAAGVHLPPPPKGLRGARLARALVHAGTAPDGTFWAGELFDHLLSHNIHDEVMSDADKVRSWAFDQNLHRLTNQSMFDIAHALGMKNVRLASLH